MVHLSQSPIAAAPNRKLDAAVLPVFFEMRFFAQPVSEETVMSLVIPYELARLR